MEARVFSWSAGVGVCWTLILMFGTVDFVSGRGTDYERLDIYNTDSSRLTKLKRLARSEIDQQRCLESRDTSDIMEKLRSEYNTFYDLLSVFVPQLKSKFISGAPADLAKVDVLLSILPKDDSAFDNGDVTSVVKRANLTAMIAYGVAENVGPFVQSDQQNWLSNQKRVIESQRKMLLKAIFPIVSEDIETPKVIPAGIGGMNHGVTTFTRTVDYKKILDLYNAMKQGSD